jgi:hypothetical protein
MVVSDPIPLWPRRTTTIAFSRGVNGSKEHTYRHITPRNHRKRSLDVTTMPRQQRRGKPVTKRQALFLNKRMGNGLANLPVVDQEYSPSVASGSFDLVPHQFQPPPPVVQAQAQHHHHLHHHHRQLQLQHRHRQLQQQQQHEQRRPRNRSNNNNGDSLLGIDDSLLAILEGGDDDEDDDDDGKDARVDERRQPHQQQQLEIKARMERVVETVQASIATTVSELLCRHDTTTATTGSSAGHHHHHHHHNSASGGAGSRRSSTGRNMSRSVSFQDGYKQQKPTTRLWPATTFTITDNNIKREDRSFFSEDSANGGGGSTTVVYRRRAESGYSPCHSCDIFSVMERELDGMDDECAILEESASTTTRSEQGESPPCIDDAYATTNHTSHAKRQPLPFHGSSLVSSPRDVRHLYEVTTTTNTAHTSAELDSSSLGDVVNCDVLEEGGEEQDGATTTVGPTIEACSTTLSNSARGGSNRNKDSCTVSRSSRRHYYDGLFTVNSRDSTPCRCNNDDDKTRALLPPKATAPTGGVKKDGDAEHSQQCNRWRNELCRTIDLARRGSGGAAAASKNIDTTSSDTEQPPPPPPPLPTASHPRHPRSIVKRLMGRKNLRNRLRCQPALCSEL